MDRESSKNRDEGGKMKTQETSMLPIFAKIAAYIIGGSGYFFLTATIVLTFGVLVFDYITILGPEMPFLKNFSFLVPSGSTENINLNEGDIMWAYSLLSMIFFLLSLAGKGLVRVLRRFFHRAEESGNVEDKNEGIGQLVKRALKTFLRNLIISSVVILLVFITAFIALPFARLADGTQLGWFYLIFGFFLCFALFSNVIFLAIDSTSGLLQEWANSQSRRTMGPGVGNE
jgi:hypothetical protein